MISIYVNRTGLPEGWYLFEVSDAPGCPYTTDTITIERDPLPVTDAGEDQTIPFGSEITLSGSGGVEYQWSPRYNLSNSNISNPTIRLSKTTTFRFTITDERGCEVYDRVTITVEPPNFSGEKLEYMLNERDCCTKP